MPDAESSHPVAPDCNTLRLEAPISGPSAVQGGRAPEMGCDDIHLDLPGRRVGKVRVSYALPDGRRLFVTTDRLSAFDRVVAVVPYKGQVLNELAAWWFDQTRGIVANHVVSVPDPNATIGVEARPIPVEVVVRGVITGNTSTSLWRQYDEGARVIYGHAFPDGLRKNTRLPEAIITPTTKGEGGAHDEPLTSAEVVERGLVGAAIWAQVQTAALALFTFGQRIADRAGLILADTKYEFGISPDGSLLLIDEVHTPDSSRYWEASSYEDRVGRGLEPESLDKEPVRLALDTLGYRGNGEPPVLGHDVIAATTNRYIAAYERITNTRFVPGTYPVEARVLGALNQVGV